MKRVIFDFNRTLYDPDTGSFVQGGLELLETLAGKGLQLFLITHGEGRQELIAELGLSQFFTNIVFSQNKSVADFQRVLQGYQINPKETFVIGDRVKGEIEIGNRLGLTTIWFKSGKFKDEFPEQEIQQPDFTIESLEHVLGIVGE